MKNSALGKRIKKLRLESGISQEKLSEISELNMRTIQRIENGETEPRGDSLKRIARALNLDIKELTTLEISKAVLNEDKWILRLLSISAFGFLIQPLLGIIFPLILWTIYRNQIRNVNEIGRQILRSQIFWCFVLYATYLYFGSIKIFHLRLPLPNNPKTIIIVIFALYFANILSCSIQFLKSLELNRSFKLIYAKLKLAKKVI